MASSHSSLPNTLPKSCLNRSPLFSLYRNCLDIVCNIMFSHEGRYKNKYVHMAFDFNSTHAIHDYGWFYNLLRDMITLCMLIKIEQDF
jgi:hypothetical protein